jgi:hypothetical protein
MPHLHADEYSDLPLSYAVRRGTPRQTLANRVGVTSLLFGAAMAASVLLGRPRR